MLRRTAWWLAHHEALAARCCPTPRLASSKGGGVGGKEPPHHHHHPTLASTPPTPPAPPFTALDWLARSTVTPPGGGEGVGPLPQVTLNRLFRARAVRMVVEGGGGAATVCRAAAAAPLPPGARVLVPASALAAAAAAAGRPRPADPDAPPSPATLALGALLSTRVLLALPAAPGGGFLVLDKPAGVRVQGGGGGRGGGGGGGGGGTPPRRPHGPPPLDEAARASLGVRPGGQEGEDGVPRLVHRLDAGASGCLALATGRPAAAWLAAAFAAPAAAGVAANEGRGARGERGPAVTKTYWALVDGLPYGALPDPTARPAPAAGCGWGPTTHVGPLPLSPHSPRGVGAYKAALDEVRGTGPPPPQETATWWRVVAARGGWAWLEMRPLTGRKHQLRRIAAGPPLGAPIVGDDRYGAVRSPRARAVAAAVAAGAGAAATPPGALFLHCASLRVALPGAGCALVRAPAPPHLDAALRWLGWGRLLDAKQRARQARVHGFCEGGGEGQRRLRGAPRPAAGRRRGGR